MLSLDSYCIQTVKLPGGDVDGHTVCNKLNLGKEKIASVVSKFVAGVLGGLDDW